MNHNERIIAEVDKFGGVLVMWPDGIVRHFLSKDRALRAIKKKAEKTVDKLNLESLLSEIEWRNV
jgi:hypothetical protein